MSTSTDDSGNNEAILGAFARLRQVAAFAKIDATVAIAKSILEEEPSIVIFSYFVAVAKEVHRKLEHVGWKGEILAGETPSAKRQDMVDRFQVRIMKYLHRNTFTDGEDFTNKFVGWGFTSFHSNLWCGWRGDHAYCS